MRRLMGMVLCGLVLGCAPTVEVYRAGNEYVQNAYSRNVWHPNWQRVTYCWKLQDGYCPKDDTRVEAVTQIAMESWGQKAAVGAVANTPLALGVGLGLSHMQAARMTQSATQGVNQPINTSTLYTNSTLVPGGVAR